MFYDYGPEFKKLNKRLDNMEKELTEIKDGVKRNDNHISFITRLYFMLRKPVFKLVNYLGYEVNTEIPDEDITTGEELVIEVEKLLNNDEIKNKYLLENNSIDLQMMNMV